MILVVTNESDATADLVIAAVEELGGDVVRFNTERFPGAASLGISINDQDGAVGKLDVGFGRGVKTDNVSAVYYRRPKPPAIAHADEVVQRFMVAEANAGLRGFLSLLRVPWINDAEACRRAEYKPLQLHVASRLGLSIPRTLLSNDPTVVGKFLKSLKGDAIVKTVHSPIVSVNPPLYIYSTRLHSSDEHDLSALPLGPCLFQEYVAKRLEVRVNVIGDCVLAAELDSQATSSGRDDWRRAPMGEVPIRPHRLATHLQRQCVSLARTLDLTFCALDFIVTDTGHYVFLECNPNGEWGWLDDNADLPIARTIAATLLSY